MPRALIVSAGNNANEYLARHMADLGYTAPRWLPAAARRAARWDAKDFEAHRHQHAIAG